MDSPLIAVAVTHGGRCPERRASSVRCRCNFQQRWYAKFGVQRICT